MRSQNRKAVEHARQEGALGQRLDVYVFHLRRPRRKLGLLQRVVALSDDAKGAKLERHLLATTVRPFTSRRAAPPPLALVFVLGALVLVLLVP